MQQFQVQFLYIFQKHHHNAIRYPMKNEVILTKIQLDCARLKLNQLYLH